MSNGSVVFAWSGNVAADSVSVTTDLMTMTLSVTTESASVATESTIIATDSVSHTTDSDSATDSTSYSATDSTNNSASDSASMATHGYQGTRVDAGCGYTEDSVRFIVISTLENKNSGLIYIPRWANSAWWYYFSYFYQKTGLDWIPLEKIYAKCLVLFSGENKKNSSNMSSAENFTPSAKR